MAKCSWNSGWGSAFSLKSISNNWYHWFWWGWLLLPFCWWHSCGYVHAWDKPIRWISVSCTWEIIWLTLDDSFTAVYTGFLWRNEEIPDTYFVDGNSKEARNEYAHLCAYEWDCVFLNASKSTIVKSELQQVMNSELESCMGQTFHLLGSKEKREGGWGREGGRDEGGILMRLTIWLYRYGYEPSACVCATACCTYAVIWLYAETAL